MTDKQIIFNCDVDCIKKNTEECFELECIYGQESILKQLASKQQECEGLNLENFDLKDKLQHTEFVLKTANVTLKLKEQQLDQLKSENDVLFKAIEEVNKINKKLKVENEELKKTIDDLLHKPEIQDKILWKIDNEALLGSKDAWVYRLEQTLQEIKGIASLCSYATPKDFYETRMKQILQKINECEVQK